MTMPDTAIAAAAEMPASFRARLDAALARPVLLDPRAIEGVRAAAGFRPRAAMADGGSAVAQPFARDGDVAIVSVEGPLAQRAWSCWMFEGDGYDAIESRVKAALADRGTRAVVLRIDSPGGEIAGCFECVRAIRAAAAAAGKPVVAYADEMATSAAYALASAAEAVVLPDTGCVGSVGVIIALTECSQALKTQGVSVAVLTSGKAKADGHPALPLADDARARLQADVDYLAGVFAGEVATARKMTRDAVLALEAACFYGGEAVAKGLADRVGNLAAAVAHARDLASARSTARPSAAAPTRTTPRGKTMQTLLTALGLAPDASEAEALTAVHSLQTSHRQLLGLAGAATAAEALGTFRAWQASHVEAAALRAELAQVRAGVERAERDRLLDEGVDEGKIPPAERGFWAEQPLATLQAYLAAAAPKVKTKREVAPCDSATGAGAVLTAREREICRATGVSEAEYLAAKRERAARA
jgi:signal peptide peptidase SppA